MFSVMAYPYWMMVVESILVVLGIIGFAFRGTGMPISGKTEAVAPTIPVLKAKGK